MNCSESWDENNAQYRNTTPVALFADGAREEATDQELWDMSGSVWEWSSSGDKDGNPYLRAGSWGDSPYLVRCALRDWNLPDGRYGSVGFRVVFSLAADS